MPNPAYDRQHRIERADWARLIDSGHPVTCPRCGKPIRPGDAWDLGHAQDLALGGDKRHRRPEHANCNRSAGAALAAQPTPSRNW